MRWNGGCRRRAGSGVRFSRPSAGEGFRSKGACRARNYVSAQKETSFVVCGFATNNEFLRVEIGIDHRRSKNDLVVSFNLSRSIHQQLLEVLTPLRLHPFVFDGVENQEPQMPKLRITGGRKQECR